MHGVRDASVRQKDADYARACTCVSNVKMDERIIECVRNRELLYNHKLKDYKHASKKQEAWEQIAAELNITATECKTKWNLLRNAFIHAISRRKTVTGQGVKNFKKWKYEDEMSFLLPFMANRNTIAAPVGEFSHETTESPGAEISQESFNENNTQQKRRHLDNYHEDMLKLMKARSQKRSEKNDIDLFFNSIAETVKNFPKLEQVRLKFKIMHMVHEVEMKMCLESDGASSSNNTSTLPHFNRHTFSPHDFSPSPQSFDTHYSLSPPVAQQVSSPQFVPQSSLSPQITYSPSPPVTQLVSSSQYVPQSPPSPQITYSPSPPATRQVPSPQYVPQSSLSPQIASPSPPVTEQVSSPQYVPQSSPSPQIAYSPAPPVTEQVFSPQYVPQSSLSSQIAYCPSPPVTQQVSSPHYVPQSSPSPQIQIAYSPSHSVTQQVSSLQFVPLSSPSPQMAYHTSSSPNIQPSTSQISQSLLTSNTQDSAVEISIPELNSQQSSKKTSTRSQGAFRYLKGPAQYIIIKKKK